MSSAIQYVLTFLSSQAHIRAGDRFTCSKRPLLQPNQIRSSWIRFMAQTGIRKQTALDFSVAEVSWRWWLSDKKWTAGKWSRWPFIMLWVGAWTVQRRSVCKRFTSHWEYSPVVQLTSIERRSGIQPCRPADIYWKTVGDTALSSSWHLLKDGWRYSLVVQLTSIERRPPKKNGKTEYLLISYIISFRVYGYDISAKWVCLYMSIYM